ncbi:MAG TPA: hypothetical protein VMY76_04860 [Gemmatimonadales bacterium]|nr:hypothetical protein [Gemmatimonadales bacterium]
MLRCLTVTLGVCLLLPVASARLAAQAPTSARLTKGSIPPSHAKFRHHKKLQAAYDSVADSTHLSVRTHKGQYFLNVQRPRLTWMVVYAGRQPSGAGPAEVWLEFRTQNPQIALDSRVDFLYGTGQRFEVPSAGAYSDPGVLTWSHFMRFPIPTASLAEALQSQKVLVSVGRIAEYLEPEQLEALRDLLSRVGAYPPSAAPDEGA